MVHMQENHSIVVYDPCNVPIPKSFTTLFNLSFDANEAVDLETTDSFETSILFKKQLCACWIGSQGTITPLHFDTCHGLLAVLHGSKK